MTEIIINDLGNYRHKRVLGLAAMFGDQLVSSKFLTTLYHVHATDWMNSPCQIKCPVLSSWK